MKRRQPVPPKPIVGLVVALLGGLGLPALLADEPKGNFEVHELSLWMYEPGNTQANVRTAYPSALPPSVNSARKPTAGESKAKVGPLAVLSFYGEPATNLDIDVRTKGGSLLAHWPPGEGLPNRVRWSGMPPFELARSLGDPGELLFVEADHWIRKAREGEALYLRHGARSERFVAYDLELQMPPPLRLEGGPEEYTIVNTSTTPIYDVLICQMTPAGRRVAWIDVVPPSTPAAPPKPAANEKKKPANPQELFDDAPAGGEKPTAPADPAKAAAAEAIKEVAAKQEAAVAQAKADAAKAVDAVKLFGGLPAKPEKAKPTAPVVAQPAEVKPADAKPAVAAEAESKPQPATKLFGGLPAKAAKPAVSKPADSRPADSKPAKGALFGGLPATKKPATAPQPAPAAPKQGMAIKFAAPIPAGSEAESTAILQELTRRLVAAGLKAHEVESFVERYRGEIPGSDSMVVVGRLSAAVLDEKLPLSVFPEPTKVVRVPIVLLRNADPQLANEVDLLVAQLGDPAYVKRQAAHKRLFELGSLAFPKLQKALENPDLEIVMRCEKLLLSQNQTPNPSAKQAAPKAVQVNGVIMPAAAPAVRVQ